jgi:hypothetical protein
MGFTPPPPADTWGAPQASLFTAQGAEVGTIPGSMMREHESFCSSRVARRPFGWPTPLYRRSPTEPSPDRRTDALTHWRPGVVAIRLLSSSSIG